MGLFKRDRTPEADPADIERWRGRSAELPDAGGLAWQVVLASLATTPADDPIGSLGLVHDDAYARGDGDSWTAIYHGVRNGRPVVLNQGAQGSGGKGAQVAWVCAATPEVSLVARDDRMVAEGTPPAPIEAFLASLGPSPKVWKDVHIVGGAEGVVAKRPIKMSVSPQAWIYDVWLAERVADLVGTAVLPEPEWQSSSLPYDLDRGHTW